MEERDVQPFAAVERKLESPGGQGLSKLLLAAFGIVTTALLASINGNLHAANELAAKAMAKAEQANDTNYQQDRDLALLKVRTDAIERKTDATVQALHALTLQVTKNGDAIEHARGRP